MKLFYSVLFFLVSICNTNAQIKIDSTSLYFNQKKYNQAAEFSIKNNLLYKLDEFGFDLYKKSDYENSLFFFLKAKENANGSYNESDYKSLLEMIGYNYQNLGDYKNAIIYFEEAFLINTKLNGQFDESNLSYLANLLVNYKAINNYKKLCEYYQKVIIVQEKKFGKNNPECLKSINNLAYYYNLDGNFKEAESLYTQVLNIRKETLGENNIDYILSLSNLATLYMDKGDYTKAEAYCSKSVSIRKKLLGEEDSSYAIYLSNLAEVYRIVGNFDKAEALFIEALSIQKKVLSENDLSYSITLNNLAVLYKDLGLYSKAEPINIQVLKIQKDRLGEDNPNYAISLSNLAALYRDMGKYTKADSLYTKAIAIQKKILGEDNPEYASSLSNLAALFSDIGDYSKADILFRKTLEIQKKVFGEYHADYANSLSNYANLCSSKNDLIKAESLYNQVLEIQKKVLGDTHPDYANTLDNLAQLYIEMNKLEKAKPLFYQSIPIRSKYLQKTFTFLNNKELVQFLDYNQTKQEFYFSLLSKNNDIEIKNQLADFNIFIKGSLFYKEELLDQLAGKNKDSIVLGIWEQYKLVRIQISQILQKQTNKQNVLKQLQNQSDSLEKVLMRKVPEFQNIFNSNTIGWKEVKNKIKTNEAVVDFVNFKYYDKRWTDTVLYAAFITQSGWSEPQFIKLFNEDQLAELFDSSSNSLSINNLYFENDSSFNSKLYNLVWKPMDSLLTGVKRVYISPSGLLNRVSFSAIPIPGGGRLIDRYSVEVMSSIRTIAETKSNVSEKPQSISLIGGVNYDEEPTVSDSQQVDFLTSDTSFSNLRSLKGGKWSYLLGAESEVITINKVLAPLKMSLSLKTGSNASEEFVKEMGSGIKPVPSVMHIATHGFSFASPKSEVRHEKSFLQNDNKQVFRSSEDALTRAGLVMAGGNKFWTTGTTYQNHEDGILTAREISELNLNGCILATLSACETGLGEIKGSEGVFGLQRAFKMAGVKYLIVSLWKVPDAQTTEFMQLFYSSWLIQKLPIREAFHQTQLAMSKKYLPYQWAAFVLVE